jgi:hypothetical protein
MGDEGNKACSTERTNMSSKLAIRDATNASPPLQSDHVLNSPILYDLELINSALAIIVFSPELEEILGTLEGSDVFCSEGWVDMHKRFGGI